MLKIWARLVNNPMSSWYAILLFVVVSILFSLLYYTFVPLIEGSNPLRYSSNQFPLTEVASFLDCLYFSIITQTTVGYGDIIPISVLGKTCTIVQAAFGYLYLAFLISIFTSKTIMKSRKIQIYFQNQKAWAQAD